MYPSVFNNSFSNNNLDGTLIKNNPVITKKDMLRERSLKTAGKQTRIGVKQGLNPYQYVPKS